MCCGDTIVQTSSKEMKRMSSAPHIGTISETIRAKLHPHLAALSQLVQSEIENMRIADMDREDVILRLQNSVLNNNKMIVQLTDMYVDFRSDIDDIMTIVSKLESAVTTYDEKIEILKSRLDTLERK